MELRWKSWMGSMLLSLLVVVIIAGEVEAWTGAVRGRVVCDVCGDSFIGPEDHVLEGGSQNHHSHHGNIAPDCTCCTILVPLKIKSGAEVAVLCLTKSGEVVNYQAFTNPKGIYTVAETMPESDRWDSCLVRPISSFDQHCTRRGDTRKGIKFNYDLPSGQTRTMKPFLYRPASFPTYCA